MTANTVPAIDIQDTVCPALGDLAVIRLDRSLYRALEADLRRHDLLLDALAPNGRLKRFLDSVDTTSPEAHQRLVEAVRSHSSLIVPIRPCFGPKMHIRLTLQA